MKVNRRQGFTSISCWMRPFPSRLMAAHRRPAAVSLCGRTSGIPTGGSEVWTRPIDLRPHSGMTFSRIHKPCPTMADSIWLGRTISPASTLPPISFQAVRMSWGTQTEACLRSLGKSPIQGLMHGLFRRCGRERRTFLGLTQHWVLKSKVAISRIKHLASQ